MTEYTDERYWTEKEGFLDECECRDLANDDLWADYDEDEAVEDMYSSIGSLWRAVCEEGVDSIRDEICDKARDDSDYAFTSTAEMTDDETFEVYGREYYKLRTAAFYF